MSDSQIESALNGWELSPLMDGEKMTGVLIVKGYELHFCPTPEFRINRAAIREALAAPFDRHGFLTTRVLLDDKDNQRFNKLFGFAPTWADDKFQYFILTELPFGERQSCQ